MLVTKQYDCTNFVGRSETACDVDTDNARRTGRAYTSYVADSVPE